MRENINESIFKTNEVLLKMMEKRRERDEQVVKDRETDPNYQNHPNENARWNSPNPSKQSFLRILKEIKIDGFDVFPAYYQNLRIDKAEEITVNLSSKNGGGHQYIGFNINSTKEEITSQLEDAIQNKSSLKM